MLLVRTSHTRLLFAFIAILPISGLADISSQRNILSELEAAYESWEVSDTDFRQFQESESPDEWEIQDYAEFVASLKRRVIMLCQEARQAGISPESVGIDCSELSQADGQAGNTPTAQLPERPLSAEEQEAVLLAKLETIESEFDELLVSEQELIYRKDPAGGSEGTGSGGGAGGQSGGGTGSGASGEQGATQQQSGTGVDEGGVATQDDYEQGAGTGGKKKDEDPDSQTSPPPPGMDDDIVARQLREAAENETDPYLKEQLWKEYWKYKNSRG